MFFKGIFKGGFEFGSERSYEQMKKTYLYKTENLYKSDIMLKVEEIFDDEKMNVTITHIISQGTEKSFKNTVGMLVNMAEFAIAGHTMAWMTEEGNTTPIHYHYVEPKGDKTAVQAFLHGKNVLASGTPTEAKDALTTAIERFARHALAYERRGYVNIKLKNYKDALYDYNKSIDINPHHADAYYGRALVKLYLKDQAGAIEDLEYTIKRTFPMQPMYWQARNLKGETHFQLKQFEKALFEFKFFTKREFKTTDPNFKKRKTALVFYGKSLMEMEQYLEAVDMFNRAIKMEEDIALPFNPVELKAQAVALNKALPVPVVAKRGRAAAKK